MKKVILLGLKNKNLGDKVILDTSKYLIQQLYPDVKIKVKNLFPDTKTMKAVNSSFPQIDSIINKLQNKPYLIQILNFLKWWLSQKRGTEIYQYYKSILKKNSIVIIAGGGIIKYSREHLWNPVYSITTYCQRKKIPVFFNAVGVEGYDNRNFYSQLLKYGLNKSCVKKITTRDDFNSLKKYVKDESKISIVGDSALWTKETYNIEETSKTDTIGIGIIRGGIFTDYGYDFSEEQLINAYSNIIKKLEEKRYKWQMFCNGAKNDYRMGEKILMALNLPLEEKYLAPRPKNPIDLAKKIYSFKATISARLHANIIAVSYNVPTIGIIWNDKLKLFGKVIGCPERFIKKEDFANPDFVIEKLEQAILDGYDRNIIESLKLKTKEALNNFLIEGKIND